MMVRGAAFASNAGGASLTIGHLAAFYDRRASGGHHILRRPAPRSAAVLQPGQVALIRLQNQPPGKRAIFQIAALCDKPGNRGASAGLVGAGHQAYNRRARAEAGEPMTVQGLMRACEGSRPKTSPIKQSGVA